MDKVLLYVGIGIALVLAFFSLKLIGLLGTVVLFVILVIVGVILLLAFTTGFKKTGRLMGGLFAIIGKPGEGKTYVCTAIAIEGMKEGRRVFSNYPIVTVDGEYCTRVIEGLQLVKDNMGNVIEERVIENIRYLMRQNLNRAMLILDEAHLFFWSRDFKKFSDEDKNFFTFLGQHEISLYYIVQHENRMDTIANDCANLFCEVTKFEIPFINMPLFFTLTWWGSEEDLRDSYKDPNIEPYLIERRWFSLDVANAYDTRFFGHDRREFYEGITWMRFKADQGIDWEPPSDVSLAMYLMRRVKRLRDNINKSFEKKKNELLYPVKRVEKLVKDGLLYRLEKVYENMPSYIRGRLSFIYWTIRVWYVFEYLHWDFKRRLLRLIGK